MEKFRYKINIRPIGSYFFGSEKKFNPCDELLPSNYLVESMYFPQQTTLLGMVRYALLFNKIKTTCGASEFDLIGNKSFDGQINKYGIIDNISDLYIERNNQLYEEAGLNIQKDNNNKSIFLFPEQSIGKGISFTTREKEIWKLNGYNPKDERKHYLIPQGTKVNIDNIQILDNLLLPYEDVFDACPQSGNHKDRNGEPKTEGYYKQTKYRLKKGFSFCFFLETSQKLESCTFNAFMGGDQSEFNVTVSEEINKTITEEKLTHIQGFVTLLSDAYISNDFSSSFDLSIAETVDFRNMRVSLQSTGKYDYTKPGISERLIKLIAKGSVFYCSDIQKFIEFLDAEQAYKQIGYNQYKFTGFNYLKMK